MADKRSPVKVLVAYSAFRLLLFAVPFLVIWALSDNPTLAAVLAAVIGLALSVILLDFQRNSLSRLLSERVERRRPSTDEAVEDDALRTQTDSAAASPKP